MFGRRFALFKLFGFQVWIDLSWFVIALLITWSLATGVFPQQYKGLSSQVYWAMGAATALGLFGSIVLHELGHSKVAQQHGVQMKGITLFIFGGVAEMTDEPPSAKAEFLIAVAGPLVSIVIAAYGFAIELLGHVFQWPVPLIGVINYIWFINLVLVVFNLVPAFPLDGGRVLRSVLWAASEDLRWATRITSTLGSAFGLMLIILGVLQFVSGNIIGGMWAFLIGMFVRQAAQGSYEQLIIRRALEGEPVSRFMQPHPVTVPAEATVQSLIDDYFYRNYHKMYPVTVNGDVVGCVSTKQIKEVPRDQWSSRRAGALAERCSDANTIQPWSDAMQALSKMSSSGASRLMVVDDGQLVGVISLKDLLNFLSLKIEMEET